MAKVQTIYPLRGVFTNLLNDTTTTNFLIPTYQRGYKWVAGQGKGQVDRLMKDLLDAYNENRSRYYLQFITTKANNTFLEVIDGQQRLTTITILFSVLGYLNNADPKSNFVYCKLVYEIRKNFIEQFIYNNIEEVLHSVSWENFIENKVEHDNQDIYFIFNAARAILAFLQENLNPNYDRFQRFVSENVYLIINLLDPELNSEKVFVNVNKGVKLNDEDLVKGLLITKVPVDVQEHKLRMSDIEVNEIRANLGRQWDDISLWASKGQIRDFFGVEDNDNRLEWLIHLSYPNFKSDESINPLFNYFDDAYRKKTLVAHQIFAQIRRTKLTLNDWFCEPEIANLLGYAIHSESSQRFDSVYKDLLKFKTKAQILSRLKKIATQRLPVNDTSGLLEEVNYEDHKEKIKNLFLLLDIAKFLPVKNKKAQHYNFAHIANNHWSLEHIFPQNLKDFSKLSVLLESDLEVIKSLLPKQVEDVTTDQNEQLKFARRVYVKINKAKDKLVIKDDEKEYLAILLKDNAKKLHTIGNLALLPRNINSSLSNHFFEGKRKLIVAKISEGKFVPYHTYDVFSKLIISGGTGLRVWTETDIDTHEIYIKEQLAILFNYLRP